MVKWTVYTDGSFGDDGLCHGGIVYITEGTTSMIHVTTSNKEFVSMRNVGGEIIAAWAAVTSIVGDIIKKNEEFMDTYVIDLVYDYKGVGEWASRRWKTNKRATKWFAQAINYIINTVPNLTVNYVWVKGHEDNFGNNVADAVAAYDMRYVRENDIPVCDLDSIIKLEG